MKLANFTGFGGAEDSVILNLLSASHFNTIRFCWCNAFKTVNTTRNHHSTLAAMLGTMLGASRSHERPVPTEGDRERTSRTILFVADEKGSNNGDGRVAMAFGTMPNCLVSWRE